MDVKKSRAVLTEIVDEGVVLTPDFHGSESMPHLYGRRPAQPLLAAGRIRKACVSPVRVVEARNAPAGCLLLQPLVVMLPEAQVVHNDRGGVCAKALVGFENLAVNVADQSAQHIASGKGVHSL